ncbi:MAG: DNA-binding response regulator [Chloroflexi bacterium]|nr:MAG: DNA-binding response regulator [Chloroflexota bacterium]
MKERKILIIDDDPELLKLLKKGLERRNFSLITAQNGPEGLRLLYEHKPSLVILDIMMPKMDGWEVCRRIREMTNAPIIILTAKAREEDIIYGLDLGADDYVTKPFSISELVARIEAILRRMEETNPYGWGELSSYTVGDLEINFARRKVKVKGKDVDLTPTEFRLLAYLVRNAGKVIPHRTLLSQVWGPAYKEETDYLKLYVHYLRQKIEEDPRNPCYIITEWGVGYYFNGEG